MEKNIDLTNYISGDLTVLERDYEYPKTLKKPSIYWKCQCKCGAIIPISHFRLTTNDSRHKATKCKACARKEKRIDLSGKKFGRLTVLKNSGQKSGGHFLWECKCDCGNIKLIDASHLVTGLTKSCGCLFNDTKINNLTGKHFGKLTVLQKAQKPEGLNYNDTNAWWLCECECGTKKIIRGSQLIHGQQSCGCISSLGEQKIKQLLNDNQISYETQKIFLTCRFPDTNYPAKFDFYINNNFLLEFDGIQHYKYTEKSWNTKENFLKRKYRDNFKNQWCLKNNIPLKRIPYWILNDLTIEDILSDKYLIKEEEEKENV